MSLNESLVQVTKYNATELPEAFEYQLKPLMSEDSGEDCDIMCNGKECETA